MKNKYLKIIDWNTSDDTGSSSKVLCRKMLGLEIEGRGHAPSDAGDRGRCIRLLNLVPEWWDRLDEMSEIAPVKAHVYRDGVFTIEERGWKEQIPLIKSEATLLAPKNEN